MSKKYLGKEIKDILSSVKNGINTKQDTLQEMDTNEVKRMWNKLEGSEVFLQVAPSGEIDKWNYELDDSNNAVILNSFKTTNIDLNVIVYDKYIVNNIEYDTYLGEYFYIVNCDMETIQFSDLINCSKLISLEGAFYNNKKLINIEFGKGFNTSNVISMASMFERCSSLTKLDLSTFDISNVEYMGDMFKLCSSLTELNLTSFDTSNVTNMGNMFHGCSLLASLDLTSFDINNVTYMTAMFAECTNLTEILVSEDKWVVNGTYINMFLNCGCSEVTYVD